jgi:hypothetical protein
MSAAGRGEIVVESTIRPGAVRAVHDLLDVGRTGDHGEHHITVGEIGRRVDDRGPKLG